MARKEQGSLLPEEQHWRQRSNRAANKHKVPAARAAAQTLERATQRGQQKPQRRLGYDPTDNVAVAQELLNRVKALNLEGVNARVDPQPLLALM